jgi:hypothetical protein
MKFPVSFLRLRFTAAKTAWAARRLVLRIISLIMLAAVLSGCSTLKIVYNQAPDLAYWYLDGHLNFTEVQSLQLKDELGRLQAWHRQTQLPIYLETLQKLQPQLAADISAPDACAVYVDLRIKLTTLTEQAEPAMAALAVTLHAGQFEQLERKFAKGNADYREDFLEGSLQARRDKRYQRAVSGAERLYGALSRRQLDLVKQAIAQSRFDPARAYAERLRRQSDVLATLRALSDTRLVALNAPEQARASTGALIRRSFNSPSPAYRDYADKLTQEACQSFADLHNSSSAAQRSKAQETLGDYQQILKALIAQK